MQRRIRFRKFIVLAVFRCEVSKKDTGNRDFQAIIVSARTGSEAIKKVHSQKLKKYKNTDGEWVSWPLMDIMAYADIADGKNGEELVGFMAGKHELYGKESLIKPTLSYLFKPSRFG